MTLVVGILLLLGCALLGYLAFRRVRLMRGGGVDVCLRRRSAVSFGSASGRGGAAGQGGAPGRDGAGGWHSGVGRYRGDQLAWYRLTSFRPGATVVVDRTELEVLGRRDPTGAEAHAVPAAASVLTCRVRGDDVELAMGPGAMTGFLAWLESGPPGYRQAS